MLFTEGFFAFKKERFVTTHLSLMKCQHKRGSLSIVEMCSLDNRQVSVVCINGCPY